VSLPFSQILGTFLVQVHISWVVLAPRKRGEGQIGNVFKIAKSWIKLLKGNQKLCY
jgi:hypothetical protein